MPSQTSPIPAWTRHAVFYEVYPQTFFDTNGDGIGDIEGIIQKLDYIQSVGATALWINPFYLSHSGRFPVQAAVIQDCDTTHSAADIL